MKKKIISITLAVILILICCCGCVSEADKVNHNLTKQAEEFECLRRITVYNARTDNVIAVVEGYLSLSNNSTSELVITTKIGANQYKKNYVYLTDYTLYFMEDITGTYTDPYHYKVYLHYNVLPDIEVMP